MADASQWPFSTAFLHMRKGPGITRYMRKSQHDTQRKTSNKQGNIYLGKSVTTQKETLYILPNTIKEIRDDSTSKKQEQKALRRDPSDSKTEINSRTENTKNLRDWKIEWNKVLENSKNHRYKVETGIRD